MQPSCFTSGHVFVLVCIVSITDSQKKVCSLFLPFLLFVSICAQKQITRNQCIHSLCTKLTGFSLGITVLDSGNCR